jgi:CheY-like chemotaxis protein
MRLRRPQNVLPRGCRSAAIHSDAGSQQDKIKRVAGFCRVGTETEKIVLIVEDSSDDIFLLREALKLHGVQAQLLFLDDGEKAIEWIRKNDQRPENRILPSAVILDLNLPKRNGSEVLEVLRSSESLRGTPVIIFSSSNAPKDRSLKERYPNTSYIQKSVDFDEFAMIGGALKSAIATHPPAA